MLWLIIVGIIIYFLYSKAVKASRHWKERKIPYRPAKPKFSDIVDILKRKYNLIESTNLLYNDFPNERYNGIFIILTPTLLIRDPDLIKQITIKDFDHFTDRTNIVSDELDPFLTRNLAALNGSKWREMRSVLSPSFTSSKMKFMFSLVSDCAQQFNKYFEQLNTAALKEVDMKDIFSRFTNDVIATTAFGIEVDSLKDRDNEFFQMGKDATNVSGTRILRMWGYILFPKLMKFLKISVFPIKFSNFFRSIIRDVIASRKTQGIVRPDMIHLLMEAKDSLNEDDIIAQALLFFFAGFENVATVLCFMMHELAVNPDIQDKLYDEIASTMETCKGQITYEALHNMKYLDMVVSETLRKWPTGIALDRMCVKEYTIPGSLAGEKPLKIEEGTRLLIPIVSLQHDPKYFPNPDQFDPDRFGDESKNEIIPFSYNPFGCGPRNCIASRFALMEMKVLAFHFLAKFKLIPTKKTPIPLIISRKKWVLAPDEGFWLGLERRQDTSL